MKATLRLCGGKVINLWLRAWFKVDNFAIVVSDLEGNEFFFIILCNKPFFTFKEDFSDGC